LSREILPSQLGFEFKDELPIIGNFIIADLSVNNFNETGSDTKNSDKEPKEPKKAMVLIKSPCNFKVTIAKDGRFVAIIKKSDFLYLQNIVP
jgi:hypothetical protein